MLLSERSVDSELEAGKSSQSKPVGGFAGGAATAIELFAGLPETWSGAFSLAASGGFRISSEAAQGQTRYVAIKSLLGGTCRIVNPWGCDEDVRIMRGPIQLFITADALLEFETESNTNYLIERSKMPVARAVAVRLGGRPRSSPNEALGIRIGIPADTRSVSALELVSRLPAGDKVSAVVSTVSRIDRARAKVT